MTDEERKKLAKEVAWETFVLFFISIFGGIMALSIIRWIAAAFFG